MRYAKRLRIRYFRGVFSKDRLPAAPPRNFDCAIVNLADESMPGTHWVAYRVIYPNCFYFDPIGNLKPPRELVTYLGRLNILYNTHRVQKSPFDSVLCGHYCLAFLSEYGL